jgi:predicted DNA binding CopG/RHH family protein
MPSLNLEVGKNGTVEMSVCMAHGCVEYYDGEKWIKFRYNEDIEREDVDAQIIKDFNLMKRQGYKEYVDKFIEGVAVRIDENNLHEAIKDIYSVYKAFMEQYSKGRKYIDMKIKGLGYKGIYIMYHMRYEETKGKYKVLIRLEVNKDGEGLYYQFDAEVKEPYIEIPEEFRRAAGMLMLFAEYVSQPPLEQGQDQEKA